MSLSYISLTYMSVSTIQNAFLLLDHLPFPSLLRTPFSLLLPYLWGIWLYPELRNICSLQPFISIYVQLGTENLLSHLPRGEDTREFWSSRDSLQDPPPFMKKKKKLDQILPLWVRFKFSLQESESIYWRLHLYFQICWSTDTSW